MKYVRRAALELVLLVLIAAVITGLAAVIQLVIYGHVRFW